MSNHQKVIAHFDINGTTSIFDSIDNPTYRIDYAIGRILSKQYMLNGQSYHSYVKNLHIPKKDKSHLMNVFPNELVIDNYIDNVNNVNAEKQKLIKKCDTYSKSYEFLIPAFHRFLEYSLLKDIHIVIRTFGDDLMKLFFELVRSGYFKQYIANKQLHFDYQFAKYNNGKLIHGRTVIDNEFAFLTSKKFTFIQDDYPYLRDNDMKREFGKRFQNFPNCKNIFFDDHDEFVDFKEAEKNENYNLIKVDITDAINDLDYFVEYII